MPHKVSTRLPIASALTALFLGAAPAAYASTGCDRQCLKGLADQFLDSLLAHNPRALPMAAPYAVTENDVAGTLPMMGLWQTVTAIGNSRQYVIDTKSNQVVLVTDFQEDSHPGILLARLKIDGGKFSEIELDVTRNKADTGEHFNPAGLAKIPSFWTTPLASGDRNASGVLAQAGQAAFDTSVSIKFKTGCQHYEEGDKVGMAECAAPPTRPVDPKERVPVVDEDLGVVASFGDVEGQMVGAFIPNSMLDDLKKMPNRPQTILQMPAMASVVQLTKVAGGVVQGTQAYMYLQASGARSPWVK